MKRYRGLAKNV